jgi:hypothetical protein
VLLVLGLAMAMQVEVQVAVLVPTRGGGWRWWRCWCWRAEVEMEVEVLPGGGGGAGGSAGCGGGGGQPAGSRAADRWTRWLADLIFLFLKMPSAESQLASGTSFPRGCPLALGKGPFVGPAVPSGGCREFPLDTACAERNPACAESNWLSAKPWIPVVKHSSMR